eukprot:7315505-Pyramimonas_sp.AAC.1
MSTLSGCACREGATLSSTLLVGHTSQHTSSLAMAAISSGSSAARTPCATRRAPSRSMAVRTFAAGPCSPASRWVRRENIPALHASH